MLEGNAGGCVVFAIEVVDEGSAIGKAVDAGDGSCFCNVMCVIADGSREVLCAGGRSFPWCVQGIPVDL